MAKLSLCLLLLLFFVLISCFEIEAMTIKEVGNLGKAKNIKGRNNTLMSKEANKLLNVTINENNEISSLEKNVLL